MTERSSSASSSNTVIIAIVVIVIVAAIALFMWQPWRNSASTTGPNGSTTSGGTKP